MGFISLVYMIVISLLKWTRMMRIRGKKAPYQVYRTNTEVYRNSAIPYLSKWKQGNIEPKDLEKFLSTYQNNDNQMKVRKGMLFHTKL